MELDKLHVVAPTAFSCLLYAAVRITFAYELVRHGARAPAVDGDAVAPTPVVSVLKPLAGCDEDLAENLESFARLDYPEYELLLGLARRDDPAAPVAAAFVARQPPGRARIVWTDGDAAHNPKVAQLVGLTAAARGDVLVVADSNTRARPEYLRTLVARLMRPGVGLVSSLVAGTGERAFGAAIENAQLCSYIAPTIVTARAWTDRTISVGKSMAMRRRDLERVGGWAVVGSVLAEDDVLGRRFSDAGFAVELCYEPIDNPNRDISLARTMDRHTRWAKMRRTISPTSFWLEPLMTPLVVAAVVAVAFPSLAALGAWLAAAVLQCGGATLDGRLMRGRWPGWRVVPVELARAHVGLVCWLGATWSRRVTWRGHRFELGPDTRLVRVASKRRAPTRAAA